MSYRGILFDLDGTLIRSMEDHYEAWKRAFGDFGITLKSEDYYPLEGLKLPDVAGTISRKYPKDDVPIGGVIRKKEEYYLRLADGKRPEFYPGVLDFLQKLNKKEIPRAIVTAGFRKRIMKTLPADFLNLFSSIITGDDYERGKPSPEPYLKGAEKLGLFPRRCIAVENAPLGVRSAKSAGMYCIAVSATVARRQLKGADEIVDKFLDVPSVIDKIGMEDYSSV